MFNILLQVLDDGRLTDNQGRTVDFKNTVIIMTSNLGSADLLEGIDEEGKIPEATKDIVMEELKRSFRPEFLNRVDEIVMFTPLTRDQIFEIIKFAIKELEKRLEAREITIEATENALQKILDESYNVQYGARPVKRYIQSTLETKLSRMIIAGEVGEKDKLTVDTDENGEIVIRVNK